MARDKIPPAARTQSRAHPATRTAVEIIARDSTAAKAAGPEFRFEMAPDSGLMASCHFPSSASAA
jgi:hypothetical protein